MKYETKNKIFLYLIIFFSFCSMFTQIYQPDIIQIQGNLFNMLDAYHVSIICNIEVYIDGQILNRTIEDKLKWCENSEGQANDYRGNALFLEKDYRWHSTIIFIFTILVFLLTILREEIKSEIN